MHAARKQQVHGALNSSFGKKMMHKVYAFELGDKGYLLRFLASSWLMVDPTSLHLVPSHQHRQIEICLISLKVKKVSDNLYYQS